MPKKNLTETGVRRLRVTERTEFWDETEQGLILRCSPDGSKTWYLRYRLPDGRRRRLKLGYFVESKHSAYPDGPAFNAHEVEPGHGPITITEARKVASVQKGLIASKADPQAERIARRRRARKARRHTIRALGEEYIENQKKRGRRAWREEERQLDKDVYPLLGDRPVGEVTRGDIEDVLDRILGRGQRSGRKEGGKVQANRTRVLMVGFFNYAMDVWGEDIVRGNPAQRTRKPLEAESPRERVLEDNELEALWKAAEDFEPVITAAFHLRVLTGQRWNEIRTMQRGDLTRESVHLKEDRVDLIDRLRLAGIPTEDGIVDAHVWTIPKGRTKTRKNPHVLPLPPFTASILEPLLLVIDRRGGDKKEWVFDSPRRTGQPLGPVNKAFLRWREAAEVEDFLGTDVRRTVATGISRLGVRQQVKAAVLNHAPPGITGRVYDRYGFFPEKLLALAKWSNHVSRLVEEESAKVVPISS